MTKNARIFMSVVSALLISATVTACDFLGLSGPSGPGELYATIVSPNAVDGAAVLELTGVSQLGYVRSDHGDIFLSSDGGTTRVVVLLDDPGPIRFHIRVEDVAELPSVTVVQVADANNELRSSLSGYDVEWVQVADSDREFHRSTQ